MTSSGAITVRVLLFARYAELLGRSELELRVAAPASVETVLRVLRSEYDGASALPDRPLCALNEAQVGMTAPVGDGDELALLPPLAGG